MNAIIQSAEESLQCTLQEYQYSDSHLGAGEDVSPWIPYGGPNLYARYLSFDPRLGQTLAMLRAVGPGTLGRHKHRSPITGFTMSGSWGYREYDWVARAGDLIQESPGTIHTLFTDDPAGFCAYFVINGCIEFFDDQEQVVAVHDVFWFIDHYLNHCKANGLTVNQKLFRR
jgi:2,4'-dihydroxyacetophenone dioxygenase